MLLMTDSNFELSTFEKSETHDKRLPCASVKKNRRRGSGNTIGAMIGQLFIEKFAGKSFLKTLFC